MLYVHRLSERAIVDQFRIRKIYQKTFELLMELWRADNCFLHATFPTTPTQTESSLELVKEGGISQIRYLSFLCYWTWAMHSLRVNGHQIFKIRHNLIFISILPSWWDGGKLSDQNPLWKNVTAVSYFHAMWSNYDSNLIELVIEFILKCRATTRSFS